MIKALLTLSGILILKIVYGKHFKEAKANNIPVMLMLSFANCIWIMCVLIFLTITNSFNIDTILGLIIIIGYPLFIMIWTVIVRTKQLKSDKKN